MPELTRGDFYRMGYADGVRDAKEGGYSGRKAVGDTVRSPRRPKRKLSAWNKFVKANAKKPRFRLRSGAPNLKKLGVAFRKTPAGRKKRR
jgi:hypothetical protein